MNEPQTVVLRESKRLAGARSQAQLAEVQRILAEQRPMMRVWTGRSVETHDYAWWGAALKPPGPLRGRVFVVQHALAQWQPPRRIFESELPEDADLARLLELGALAPDDGSTAGADLPPGFE